MQIFSCFKTSKINCISVLISDQFDTFPTYNFEIIKELNISVLIWTELHLIFRISNSMLNKTRNFSSTKKGFELNDLLTHDHI